VAAAAGLALVTATASPAMAKAAVLGAANPNAIPGAYIVVLKDGASARPADLAARHGAKVSHTYSYALRGFAGTMSEQAAGQLAANPAVAFVEQDATVTLDATLNKITNPGAGSPNRLLFLGAGSPPPPPPASCAPVTNGTNYPIPDLGTAMSPITTSGCSGNASSASTIEVHIIHTWIGDLVVDLLAPDGSVYNLHNRAGGSADNINTTYTRDLSGEPSWS
jgi:hypothetical protein